MGSSVSHVKVQSPLMICSIRPSCTSSGALQPKTPWVLDHTGPKMRGKKTCRKSSDVNPLGIDGIVSKIPQNTFLAIWKIFHLAALASDFKVTRSQEKQFLSLQARDSKLYIYINKRWEKMCEFIHCKIKSTVIWSRDFPQASHYRIEDGQNCFRGNLLSSWVGLQSTWK